MTGAEKLTERLRRKRGLGQELSIIAGKKRKKSMKNTK